MILCSEKWILITFISTKPRKKKLLNHLLTMFIYGMWHLSIWIQKWTTLLLYRDVLLGLWRLCFVYSSADSETLNIQHHINDILTIRVGCLSTPHKSWVMLGYNCHDSSYFCYIKLYRCKYGNTEASVSRPGVVWQQRCHQQNNKGASLSKHSPATCIKSGFYKVVLSFSNNFQLI